jgi:UDP-N-acetylglucosamine 3-dehydrogenase
MADYRAAVIGAGAPPDDDGPGYAIGYAHGEGYREHEETSVVAVADLVPENAAAYAEAFDIDGDGVYEDYHKMLRAVEPDLVSVCTPPEVHADVVVDCAKAGVPAVHCEKPMATTWGDCRRMARECDRRGVQLTINHQRRFSGQWRVVKEQIDAGTVGDVTRVETAAPDLLDWGTHCFDLCGFYAGDNTAEWILGQVNEAVSDYYDGAYDHHTESQALCLWEYTDGVHGIASTGEGTGVFGHDVFHRVVGTGGTIEVGLDVEPRIRRHGDAEWRDLDFEQRNAHTGAIGDAVEGIASGREPALSARTALNATELIYGTWESARRRSRVDLPLAIEDNPLEAMIEAGDLPVRDADG